MQPLLHFGPSPKMKPLLHCGLLVLEKCNPYCILASPSSKNAPPIAFWGLGASKMQPLLQFEASGAEICNPYCILEPRGIKNATPIAV